MRLADIFKIENLPPVFPMDSPEGQGQFTIGQSMTSGNFAVDYASGIWGLPKDRIVEVFGEESSGKTTFALQCLAACNERGEKGMIIDAEHGLDWAYAQAIGVKPAFCYIEQPTSAEEALKLLLNACRAEDISVVILDSVASLVTAMELEGEIGDANIAAVARLMSANMKKLNAICSVNETLAIMINQNRSNPGAYGAIYQTGGRSLKFYASMRINVRKVSTNKKGNVAISNETEIEFKKNKLSIPYTKGSFDLVFGKGADNGKAIIEIGAKHGVIEKKGAYIAYKGAQLGQGINGASSLIEADKDLREQIIQEIKEAVAAKKKTVEPEAKEKASAVAAVSKPLKAKGGFAKRSLSLVSPEDDD